MATIYLNANIQADAETPTVTVSIRRYLLSTISIGQVLPESVAPYLRVDPVVMVPWGKYQGILDIPVVVGWSPQNALDARNVIPWVALTKESGYTDVDAVIKWSKMLQLDENNKLPWALAVATDVFNKVPWDAAKPLDLVDKLPWGLMQKTDVSDVLRWARQIVTDRNFELLWNKTIESDVNSVFRWGRTLYKDVLDKLPWNRTIPLDLTVFSGFTEGEGNIRKHLSSYDLVIRWLQTKAFLYMQTNISLTRISDGRNVPILGGSVSVSRSSWLWSFSCVPASRDAALMIDPNVQGGPVEVLLNVNGYLWKFMIESVSPNYSYGNSSYSCSGRSLSAILGDPYCEKITNTWEADTSAYALVSNIVSGTGWAIDWNVIDWTIVANSFSVTNATKAKIIAAVAKAVGAIVQTHPNEKKLSIDYKFPISPKDFETTDPDEYLLSGVILNPSSEWDARPKYNYVVVSGGNVGVTVHVKRSGTNYDRPAPPVIDPLIQDVMVGKQRGREILDEDGYDRIVVDVSSPLPPAGSGDRPKLLFPGEIVQVSDLFETWRGIVSAVSVTFGSPSPASVTMKSSILRYIV